MKYEVLLPSDNRIDKDVLNFIVVSLKGPLHVTNSFRGNITLQKSLRSAYDKIAAGFDNNFLKLLSNLSYT